MEAEWNRWYDTVHLPDALKCPGVLRGRRYVSTGDISETLAGKTERTARRVYTTIYERRWQMDLDMEPVVAQTRRTSAGAFSGHPTPDPRSRGRRSVISTILVVDDHPDARYSMARPLTAAGFDVRETATGRDALRLARLQIDAIVPDLVCPDVDGYEVLRRLKTDPATMNIPVILKTAALLEDGHRQRGLEAGAVDYFAEPFDTPSC